MSRSCLSPASRIRIAADVHRHSTSDDDSGCVLEEYSWVPSGIKPDMVHMYFACLPEDKIPYVNSVGEKWRTRQLQYQLPAQDSDPRYCGKLSAEEEAELTQFEAERKKECLGRGIIKQLPYDSKRRHCHQCKGTLSEGNLIVSADRFGEEVQWHPQCFICTECENLLVDLIYFKHGADVFCGRHHAEQIKPRCARCDELIFSEECTEAEGRTWHMSHFACNECGAQLGGQRYIAKNERVLCIPCFHNNFSLACNTCKKEIVVEKPHITQSDTHWHADERCFSCCECGKNLLGKHYSFKDGRLYCGFDECQRKRSPKVSFDSSVSFESNRRRGSVPRPPPRNPPSPPSENIYETVLPCSSRDSDEVEYPRGFTRRSHSADMRRCFEECHKKECNKRSEDCGKKQNYYSRMPPPLDSQRWKHQRCSSCSSSESDADDIYLTNYLAASLPRCETQDIEQQKSHRRPLMNVVRTAKNKSSNNCIVS
uniref:Protein espinas n=1 Tax=Ascaris suum TaxID=6253 RepID=F1L5T8_ASCSU